MARILVIDDEPDIRMATVMALQMGGHTVIEAESGMSAMRVLKEQVARNTVVDLIVCDVMMPGMTGHDVCQLVRLDPSLNEIPFIFLSAKREADERLEGIEAGADDYVGKPFALQELLIRVNSVLAKNKQMEIPKRISADPMTQLSLAQCIDMIVRHNLSGKLTALLKGTVSGTIFFEGGHAVHAKLEDKIGEAAVRSILASQLLMYSFEAYEVSDQITMAMDISRIIKRPS
ncbi:MAG: response regulator [Blastocatellia bacterium]|nr:response regulator [Blastocatellia bacterium]